MKLRWVSLLVLFAGFTGYGLGLIDGRQIVVHRAEVHYIELEDE